MPLWLLIALYVWGVFGFIVDRIYCLSVEQSILFSGYDLLGIVIGAVLWPAIPVLQLILAINAKMVDR